MISALFTWVLVFAAATAGLENIAGAGRVLTGVGRALAPAIVPILADDIPWPKEHEFVSWIVCAAAVMLLIERGIALLQHFRGDNAPTVSAGDFLKHKDDIWKVVNGHRAALARIETAIATSNVLREANGDRLKEVADDMSKVTRQFDHLAGTVERFMQEERKK